MRSETHYFIYAIPAVYRSFYALNPDSDFFDLPPYQLRNVIRGVIWRDEHFAGMAIKDIASRENLSESGIRKIIMASFDILQAA